MFPNKRRGKHKQRGTQGRRWTIEYKPSPLSRERSAPEHNDASIPPQSDQVHEAGARRDSNHLTSASSLSNVVTHISASLQRKTS